MGDPDRRAGRTILTELAARGGADRRDDFSDRYPDAGDGFDHRRLG